MRPAIRLYLDHGDLCRLADGKAREEEELLRAVIIDTGAHLMYSDAHTFDLADSNEATFDRWCRLVERLGPAFRIRCTNADVNIVPLDLGEARMEWEFFRAFWPALKHETHAAGVAGYKLYAASGPLPKGKALRRFASEVLDLTPEESIARVGIDINAALAELEISKEEALRRATSDPKQIFARDGLVAAVRSRMLGDKDREPWPTDPADREHLTFLPLVDVFTADAYTYAKIGEFNGAGATCPIPKAYSKTIVFRNNELDKVANCLCVIADDLEGTSAEPGPPR